jgi:hypothetical protein
MSNGFKPAPYVPLAEQTAAVPQDLQELVMALAKWRAAPASGINLVIVSLSATLPAAKRPAGVAEQTVDALCAIAGRRGGSVYKLSACDVALLVKASELAMLSTMRDVKVETLRVIDRAMPGGSAAVDQGRLVLSYDLSQDYRSAAGRVAKYSAEERAAQPEDAKKRGLTEADITKVLLAYNKFGSERFVKTFAKTQEVVVKDAAGLTPLMREAYFSIDLIRKPLMVDVDLRGSGRLFNEFTMTLDLIMLGSHKLLPETTGPWSLNLNVDSIFTEPFEQFLTDVPPEKLASFMIELRQADIMEKFDEFHVAQGMLKSKGVKIIVDQVFPMTAGLVNLSDLGAAYCKIHWQDGGEETLKQRKRAIQHMQQNGVTPILTRVDSPRAFDVAHDLGVTHFQGNLVDELRSKGAA